MTAPPPPASPSHWLDHLVAFASGRRRLFKRGWGDEAVLDRLATVARFEHPPGRVELRWERPEIEGKVVAQQGSFASPVEELPPEARRAVVRRLLPAGQPRAPLYVVLGASGEEGFAMRTRLFRPMVERDGIGVLFLENAMYGLRRPQGQKGAAIRTLGEQLLMNIAMVEEARALFDALADEGHAKLGITGYSMGGSMAALVAAVTPRPLAAAVFAAGRSAGPVFTEGLLSTGLDFEALGAGHGGVEGAKERLRALFGAADLERHPRPRCLEATALVAGLRDGYVFPREVLALHALWPESSLRWVESGHAGTLVFHGEVLRSAAVEAMSRLATG
jgi:hypothetical protein